jgi:hypothetical protein
MNPQEHSQLTGFLKQLSEVRLPQKDAEAEALIRDAVSRQPDAAYLLVQRALLLDQALNSAKAQIAALESQIQQQASPKSGGFLGGDPWAQPAVNPAPVPGMGAGQPGRYAPAAAMPMQAGMGGMGGMGGGASSFLGSVATTAAGVVAGSFLFQGIENLMGHHGGGGWGQGGATEEHVTEQTVINNYYGDEAIQQADNGSAGDDYLVSDDSDYGMDDSGDSDWI